MCSWGRALDGSTAWQPVQRRSCWLPAAVRRHERFYDSLDAHCTRPDGTVGLIVGQQQQQQQQVCQQQMRTCQVTCLHQAARQYCSIDICELRDPSFTVPALLDGWKLWTILQQGAVSTQAFRRFIQDPMVERVHSSECAGGGEASKQCRCAWHFQKINDSVS